MLPAVAASALEGADSHEDGCCQEAGHREEGEDVGVESCAEAEQYQAEDGGGDGG